MQDRETLIPFTAVRSIAKLRVAIAKLRVAIAKLRVAIAELGVAIAKLRVAIAKLRVAIAELGVAIAKLRVAIAELRVPAAKFLGNAFVRAPGVSPQRGRDVYSNEHSREALSRSFRSETISA